MFLQILGSVSADVFSGGAATGVQRCRLRCLRLLEIYVSYSG